MESEFATEDLKNVFSKLMQFMDEDVSSSSEKEEVLKPSKSSKIRKSEVKTPKKAKEAVAKPEKSSKKISAEEFQNTTYARMQAKLQNAGEKLKKQAQIVKENGEKEIKFKPEINKNSKKIHQQPIFERFEKIIETKKKKITEMSEKFEKERIKEQEKELTFQPNLSKAGEKQTAVFPELLDRMKEWEEKKNMRAILAKEEIEDSIKKTHTFKPEICENSLKLMESHGEGKDVAQRLFEHKKPEPLSEAYKFLPTINTKSVKLSRTRSEVKVFERLYEKSKEGLQNTPDNAET